MPSLPGLFQSDRYLFLLAHPDDEIYSAALIQRLLAAGKQVDMVYATSGDAKGMGDIRQGELARSLKQIGLPEAQLHLLHVPERQMLAEIPAIIERTRHIAANLQAQCLIGHDYEGGHEAHDALSFCGAAVAAAANLTHIVYPLYHGKPQERQGARFIPEHTHDQVELKLDPTESSLKTDIIATHASQKAHFEGLQKSAPDYLELLQTREVYRLVNPAYDFSDRPREEVGYEFHRNGFKFADFQAVVATYIPPQE